MNITIDSNINESSYFGFSVNTVINELFEEQVEKYHDNVCLIFGEKILTYTEYNQKSNQLARYLRSKGVGEDSIVAIIIEPSFEMVIGIMGILKAGGAYLPIDPSYPEVRISYMLNDSNAGLVITQSHLKYNFIHQKCFLIDKFNFHNWNNSNLELNCKSSSLAYLIYTSGTSGKPKGVMVEHRSAVNTLSYRKKEYGFNSDYTAMGFFPVAFDGFVASFFTPIISGAKVVILSKDELNDLEKIKHIITDKKVTNIISVPALYEALLESLSSYELSYIKVVTLAGDTIPKKLIKDSYQKSNSTEISVEYGVTEAAVMSTIYRHHENDENIKIGKPIANTKILILDEKLKMMPDGMPGEICISGIGVARGYINRPGLTAEKFIANPTNPNEKMYRTGDLGKWLPSGDLVFMGRLDNQVKIRGFRIETEEIETKILEYTHIQKTVVTVKYDVKGSKFLCAYYVSENEISQTHIMKFLSSELPQFMIPEFYIKVKDIPLTPNGKIDHNALPDPILINKKNYMQPITDTEKILIKSWEEVLGIKGISMNDNFFHLGGDSIKAMQIISKLINLHLKLSIKEILNNPCPRDLIQYIKKCYSNNYNYQISGKVPLTPIQKWFFENNFENKHHWNQSILLYNKQGFNREFLRVTINHLLFKHDSLRTIFTIDNNEIVQVVNTHARFKLVLDYFDYLGISNHQSKINKQIQEIQMGFDLSKGPLIKFCLFKTGIGDYLFITAHHLIIDGVSYRVLIEDINNVYLSLISGKDSTLQNKTTSYKEWALKLNEYSNSKKFISNEKLFWNKLQGYKKNILPVDYIIEKNLMEDSITIPLVFDENETYKLLNDANKSYNTKASDLLTASLVLALHKWTGFYDILINFEGHGREDIFKELDLSRTIGWFTSSFPVLFKLKDMDLKKFIINIKETLRNIPNNGIGYGILKYLTNDSQKRDFDSFITPEVNFNFLGQIDFNENMEFSIEEFDFSTCFNKKSKRLYKLDIISLIQNGKLFIYVNYNYNQFTKESISYFCKIFEDKLKDIIKHCILIEFTVPTKSDYKLINVTDKEFAHIERKISAFTKMSNVENIYPLSPMQEGMLYHYLYDKLSYAYFQQIAINLTGFVDPIMVQKAFNLIISNYESLRTIFIMGKISEPKQIVVKEIKQQFEDISISTIDKNERKNAINMLFKKDLDEKFDLEKDCLIRVKLIKLSDSEFIILLSFHHIIMDGWCFRIIFDDFINIINNLKNNQKPLLQPSLPYSKYIKWLGEFDKNTAEKYWKKYLEDFHIPSHILRKTKTTNIKKEFKEISLMMDTILSKKIIDFAISNEVTVNVVFQSVWGIFLQNYLMCNDIVFGYVVSGRPPEISNISKIVGLFINTIPLRIQTGSNDSFIDIVKRVYEDNINAKPYEHLSLSKIQSLSPVNRNLIDHIMIFENFPAGQYVDNKYIAQKTGFEITAIDIIERTEYDFTITVFPGKQNFTIQLQFVDEIGQSRFVEEMSKKFINLFEILVTNYEKELCKLSILNIEEENLILNVINNTSKPFNTNITIKEMFEQTVNLYADNIAVRYCSMYMTYSELNSKANKLARYLLQKHVQKGDIVGLILYSSIEMIVAILAVIKSGAAYLPIDPDMPDIRIRYMLSDSNVNIIICSTETQMKCSYNSELILVDSNSYSNLSSENIDLKLDSSSLAYLIYTSGSTGNPKGVMVEHCNLMAYVHSFCDYFKISDNDIFLQQASYSFDAFIEEIFPILTNGGTLAILPQHMAKDLYQLRDYAQNHKVTIISASPLLINELDKMENINSVHTYISGGDILKREHISNLITRGIVVNTYGPTETTVCSSYYMCKEDDQNIPIGKPIANYEMYIMNEELILQPVLFPGEICIGGDGVTRGYLNNEDLTKDKYVDNPYKPGHIIYRSGDLGRFLPDGNIEFLGRIDGQVKIRGYRIETGEIEKKLIGYKGISTAIVTQKYSTDNTKCLCAYYISAKEIRVRDLREYLSKHIPQFMIPAYFIRLDKIPLSASGKVNTQALPQPFIMVNADEKHIEVSTEYEKILISIFKKVLGIKKIGINDRFLDIGGDSLKALKIISNLREYGYIIKIKLLMDNKTIKDIAASFEYLEGSSNTRYNVDGNVSLHPYHLWLFKSVFNHMFEHAAHWNTSSMFFYRERFDIDKVNMIVNQLFKYHDSLRTEFKSKLGLIEQFVKPASNVDENVTMIDLRNIEVDLQDRLYDEIYKIQADSIMDKLFRVVLLRSSTGDYIYFTGNHLITDAYSDNIIYEDFFIGYEQLLKNQKLKFKSKTDPYKKWIEKMYEHSLRISTEEIEYWEHIINSIVATIKKDFNINYSKGTYKNVVSINIQLLDAKYTRLLKEYSIKYHKNILHILLAAWSIMIYKLTSAEKIRIFCVNNGRSGLDNNVDVSRTIGCFMSTYPILIDCKKATRPSDHLEYIDWAMKNIPRNGLGFDILKYLRPITSKKESSINLLVGNNETLFNYIGDYDENSAFQGAWSKDNMKQINLIYSADQNTSKSAKWTHDFNIYLIIIENKLFIHIQFSLLEYKNETINKMLDLYKKTIINLIENEENYDV